MKRKILAIALVFCMVLGMSGMSFGVEGEVWKYEPFSKTSRVDPAAAVVGDKIYVVGGTGEQAVFFPKLEIYDTNTGTWSTGASIPWDRRSCEAVSVGDIIYTIAGSDAPNALQSYNTITNTWRTERSSTIERVGHAAVAAGSKIYVIGGTGRNGYLNSLEIYDTKSGEWTIGESMPTARQNLTAAYASGKIYVVGGRNGKDYYGGKTSVMEIYDIASNSWSTGPSCPIANDCGASVGVGNKIYVMGGTNDFQSTYIYDIDKGAWEKGPSLKSTKYYFTSVYSNGRI